MDVKLYITNSDREKLSKTLTSTKSYTCTMKDTVDVLRPTIRIQTTDNLSSYNYARIERYGRYYYVTSIKTTPNGYWELALEVDPLMSYAAQIRSCYGTLTRSESIFNGYLIDNEFKAYANKAYVTKAFPNVMDDDTYILLTVG